MPWMPPGPTFSENLLLKDIPTSPFSNCIFSKDSSQQFINMFMCSLREQHFYTWLPFSSTAVLFASFLSLPNFTKIYTYEFLYFFYVPKSNKYSHLVYLNHSHKAISDLKAIKFTGLLSLFKLSLQHSIVSKPPLLVHCRCLSSHLPLFSVAALCPDTNLNMNIS